MAGPKAMRSPRNRPYSLLREAEDAVEALHRRAIALRPPPGGHSEIASEAVSSAHGLPSMGSGPARDQDPSPRARGVGSCLRSSGELTGIWPFPSRFPLFR
jgi:hypothetical protein